MAAIGPLLGANHVTLHDARVSITAGFVGTELPSALGMDARGTGRYPARRRRSAPQRMGRGQAPMSSVLPIEIVGGGLPGGTCPWASALRRSGVPVTLYEAGDYPRHRVCGEFIAGLAEGTVEALGLGPHLAGRPPPPGVTYFLRDRPLRPYALPGDRMGHKPAHARRAARRGLQGGEGGDLRTRTRLEEGTPVPRAASSLPAGGAAGRSGWDSESTPGAWRWPMTSRSHLRGARLRRPLSRTETGEVNVCGIFLTGAASPSGDRPPARVT